MKHILEVDGPPYASFKDARGNDFAYNLSVLKGGSALDLLRRYETWREEIASQYTSPMIVWRSRPMLRHELKDPHRGDGDVDRDSPVYLSWRCVVLELA